MPFIEDENGNHILDENGNKLEYSITVFDVYHKKQWCYTKTYKRLKKWKLAGDLTSVGFGLQSTRLLCFEMPLPMAEPANTI